MLYQQNAGGIFSGLQGTSQIKELPNTWISYKNHLNTSDQKKEQNLHFCIKNAPVQHKDP